WQILHFFHLLVKFPGCHINSLTVGIISEYHTKRDNMDIVLFYQVFGDIGCTIRHYSNFHRVPSPHNLYSCPSFYTSWGKNAPLQNSAAKRLQSLKLSRVIDAASFAPQPSLCG